MLNCHEKRFLAGKEDVLYYENHSLTDLVTPVQVNKLKQLLEESHYDQNKTEFLVNGFTKGFKIGYAGDRKQIKMKSANLKLVVGSKIELWNKVMKEVKELRYAGPFPEIPFENYIHSPIGLVPKDQGQKTRLIFHLSHPRDQGTSVNQNTPTELSTVKYKDFDEVVKLCISVGKGCFAGKSDLTSAFRHLCIRPEDWCLLVMKATKSKDGKTYYFVDKCLPFGAAISCSHFQAFSDALAHITRYVTKQENINYLDDFFFAALRRCCVTKQYRDSLIFVGKSISQYLWKRQSGEVHRLFSWVC